MTTPHDGTTVGPSTVADGLPRAAPAGDHPPVPVLTVLGHPDLDRIGERAVLGELLAGHEVALSRQQPHFSPPGSDGGHGRGRGLDDPFLSRRPLGLERLETGELRLRRDGSPIPVAVDGEPLADAATWSAERLDDGVVLELAERCALLLHRRPRPDGGESAEDFGLVGASAAMEAVRRAIASVAELEVPVLLRGETGTGKELVAAALHRHGGRSGGPFVSVNLGALSPALAAAELFGSRKGAYTGATRDRRGYFRRADGGTLFLDEVGEAPAELQVMLLRTLETGEVLAVGSQEPWRVDVRVIAATDAELERRIAQGAFRAPLLHRLAGYVIHLPPLRRRRDDVGRLLVHFLRQESAGLCEPPSGPDLRTPWLPSALVGRLARHRWPGNVRQLRNVARQLVIDGRGRPSLGAGAEIERLLGDPDRSGDPPPDPGPAGDAPLRETPAPAAAATRPRRRKPSQIPEDELVAALRRNRWNLKATAGDLGISRTSLYVLIDRSPRIRAPADVPPDEIRGAWERHRDDLPAAATELEVSERALRQRLKDLGLL